tara:strand:+ start:767 stop:1339 length:573 start_codon:yes stop_codon:yes gene_type:complete
MKMEKVKKEKKNTKKNLVQIAMKMFAENGYHKTSTSAICEKAGISTGLLFYHYSSKEKLLNAIIDLILSKIDKILNQTENSNPKKELENIIDEFFNSLKEERPFWDLYMALLYQPDTKELILGRVLDHSKNFRRTIYDLMKKMDVENPSDQSFEFEIFRVGIFASYLSNHDELLLQKACKKMKLKYLPNY